jgi:hypothetical protein
MGANIYDAVKFASVVIGLMNGIQFGGEAFGTVGNAQIVEIVNILRGKRQYERDRVHQSDADWPLR